MPKIGFEVLDARFQVLPTAYCLLILSSEEHRLDDQAGHFGIFFQAAG